MKNKLSGRKFALFADVISADKVVLGAKMYCFVTEKWFGLKKLQNCNVIIK